MKKSFFLAAAAWVIIGINDLSAQGSEVGAFFKDGPLAPQELPADQVYPNGRLFPLSFYSVGGGTEQKLNALLEEAEVQKEFAYYKNLSTEIFGPQYELNERALEDAKKYGLKVVYTIGAKINFHEGVVLVDPEKIYQEVSAQVKGVAANPSIAIWNLTPEELRPWRKNEMEYLQTASRAIKENDPLKRPIFIYNPIHSSAKRLASIAPWVDEMGQGVYANYASHKDSRILCRWVVEQGLEAIKQSGSQAVVVSLPEMFQQPPPEELPLIALWARHDAYLSLVTGAKGLFIFSARRRPNFDARQEYYQAYAKIADELLGEKRIGDIFLFGERRDDLQVDIVDGVQTVDFLYAAGGVDKPISYPSVSCLNVAYGSQRYIFLVNSANESVKVVVGGLPYNAVRAENLFTEQKPFDVGEGEFPVELSRYEVKAYRLVRRP